jgi:hypothetical protein
VGEEVRVFRLTEIQQNCILTVSHNEYARFAMAVAVKPRSGIKASLVEAIREGSIRVR